MRSIAVIFLFIIGLFLIGCVQVGGGLPGGLTEKEYVCADGKTIVKNISQCPAVAVTTAVEADPEMKVCEEMPEIENAQFADYCYMGLAYKRENATICKKLSQNNKINCYSGIAALKNDVTICDAAGSQKSQCYSSYAMSKVDLTACDLIPDINAKDNCYSSYASKTGELTACDAIKTTGQRDNCYQNIASQTCDVSICNKIINTNTKQQCVNNLQYCSGQSQPEKPKPMTPQ